MMLSCHQRDSLSNTGHVKSPLSLELRTRTSFLKFSKNEIGSCSLGIKLPARSEGSRQLSELKRVLLLLEKSEHIIRPSLAMLPFLYVNIIVEHVDIGQHLSSSENAMAIH